MKPHATNRKNSRKKSSRFHLSKDPQGKVRHQVKKPIQFPKGSKPAGEKASSPLKNGLYVVGTPIGNMGDITLRALEVLKWVDKIACEDTRVTRKLISRHEIRTSLTPYHEHNAETARPSLIQKIRDGAAIALVSDAGMPSISDPGYKLIRDCIRADLLVTVVPGASACLSGLVLSGLPTDRFLFQGYLPSKSSQRRIILKEISTIGASLIFYESPERLAIALQDMLIVLGNRPAAVLRELTKLHEEVRRGSLQELVEHYVRGEKPRGELVIVVDPAQKGEAFSDMELGAILTERLRNLSVRDAVAEVANITKQPRKKIYRIAVGLVNHSDQ